MREIRGAFFYKVLIVGFVCSFLWGASLRADPELATDNHLLQAIELQDELAALTGEEKKEEAEEESRTDNKNKNLRPHCYRGRKNKVE